MKHEASGLPSREIFLKNIEEKMNDSEFLGDTTALLRPDEIYDPKTAFNLVKNEIIDKM